MRRPPRVGDIVWFGRAGTSSQGFASTVGPPPPPVPINPLPAIVRQAHNATDPHSVLDLVIFGPEPEYPGSVSYASPLEDRTWCWPTEDDDPSGS